MFIMIYAYLFQSSKNEYSHELSRNVLILKVFKRFFTQRLLLLGEAARRTRYIDIGFIGFFFFAEFIFETFHFF